MALSEEQKAYQRAWCAKNRERVRDTKRRYRERQRLGIRLKARDYWRTNQEARARAKTRRQTPEGKAKRREEGLRYRAKYPDQARSRFLFEKYGVTLEQYHEMLDAQDGKCAICLQPPKASRGRGKCLEVDHNHETDTVRGLLCRRCNTLVGYLETNNSLLHVADEYIKRYESCQP